VGPGAAEGTDIGPVITAESKSRIEGLIESAEQEGARIILDGRGVNVPGHPHGERSVLHNLTALHQFSSERET
jgi:malonate-semialdehyde dehydrogenase (acetylating) / methylmalonate-semialdehyde dehydrogenase